MKLWWVFVELVQLRMLHKAEVDIEAEQSLWREDMGIQTLDDHRSQETISPQVDTISESFAWKRDPVDHDRA